MSKKSIQVDHMMAAVIQEQDTDAALKAIANVGAPVTRLASAGGFLGRKNSTILIGVHKDVIEQVIVGLRSACKQRVEYLAIPLEGSPLPMPTPIPVTVGGATIFTIPVDHFEEF